MDSGVVFSVWELEFISSPTFRRPMPYFSRISLLQPKLSTPSTNADSPDPVGDWLANPATLQAAQKCGLFQAAAAKLKHVQPNERATSAPAPPDNAAQPGTTPTKDTHRTLGTGGGDSSPPDPPDNAAQPGTAPTKGTHRTLGTGGGDSPPPDPPDNAGGGTRTTPDSAAQVRGLRGISAHAACGRCGAPWLI